MRSSHLTTIGVVVASAGVFAAILAVVVCWKKRPSPPAERWYQGGKEQIVVGDAVIDIEDSGIACLSVKQFGRWMETETELGYVDVRISTNSDSKKINYNSWQQSVGLPAFTVVDDLGNNYKAIRFPITTTVRYHIENGTAYKGQPLVDRLVFERPVDAAKEIRITLDASNIEGCKSKDFRFRIPTKFVRQ